MKTWISENPVLATIVILLVVVGVAYLLKVLFNKNGNNGTENQTGEPTPNIETSRVTVSTTTPSMGRVSSVTSSGASAGAGARVSGAGAVAAR